MFYFAKALEALGIVSLMLGLLLGISSTTLWVELYLFLFGILVFLIGRCIEKYLARRNPGS